MAETSKRCSTTALYVEYQNGRYTWSGTGAFASVVQNTQMTEILNSALLKMTDGMTYLFVILNSSCLYKSLIEQWRWYGLSTT